MYGKEDQRTAVQKTDAWEYQRLREGQRFQGRHEQFMALEEEGISWSKKTGEAQVVIHISTSFSLETPRKSSEVIRSCRLVSESYCSNGCRDSEFGVPLSLTI